MAKLSDIERRALGNLPRWRSDKDHAEAEAHMREANRYADDWTLRRSLTATELAVRLTADPYTIHEGEQAIGVDQLDEIMEGLTKKRPALVKLGGDGYSMTEAGFNALTATEDDD